MAYRYGVPTAVGSGSMVQQVDLSTLSDVLDAESETLGSGLATALACFLLPVVALDSLAVLHGDGELARLAQPIFAGQSISLSDQAAIIVVMQAALLLVGWIAASHSRIKAIVGSDLISLITFGVGGPILLGRALSGRLAIFGAFILFFFVSTFTLAGGVAFSSFAGPLVGNVLGMIFPIIASWIATVLTLRGLKDRSIIIAFFFVVLAFAIIATRTSLRVDTTLALANTSLGMAEFLVLALSTLVLTLTIVANPLDAKIYRLTAHNAATDRLSSEHSPFANMSRLPRYLTFQASAGQFIAITREHESETYEIVDVTDDHKRTPIHDRSIKIWNITRLSSDLVKEIKLEDRRNYFSATIGLGHLAMTSGAKKKIGLDRGAVDVAINAIFKNTDLDGLLKRAANRAFEDHVKPFRSVIDEALRTLDAVPTSASIGVTSAESESLDELEATISKYEIFANKSQEYLIKLSDVEKNFNEVRDLVEVWSEPGKDDKGSLEDRWLTNIMSELADVNRDGDVINFSEARRVLRVVGLRFNSVNIALEGRAQKCEERFGNVRVTLDGQTREYEVAHREALQRRTRFKEGVAVTIINQPGVVTPRSAPDVIGQILGLDNLSATSPGRGRRARRKGLGNDPASEKDSGDEPA